jgi:hypothetical protein
MCQMQEWVLLQWKQRTCVYWLSRKQKNKSIIVVFFHNIGMEQNFRASSARSQTKTLVFKSSWSLIQRKTIIRSPIAQNIPLAFKVVATPSPPQHLSSPRLTQATLQPFPINNPRCLSYSRRDRPLQHRNLLGRQSHKRLMLPTHEKHEDLISNKVDSILLVLFLIIKVVISSLVNRKGGYTTTILL